MIDLRRDQRELLEAVGRGHVYRSAGGRDMVKVRAGQNRLVARLLRELVSLGLVTGPDDEQIYRLVVEP